MPNTTLSQHDIDANIEILEQVRTYANADEMDVSSSEWEWDNGAVRHPGTGTARFTDGAEGGLVFPFMEGAETPHAFTPGEHSFAFFDAAGLLRITGTWQGRGFKFYAYLEEGRS